MSPPPAGGQSIEAEGIELLHIRGDGQVQERGFGLETGKAH